ncbi:MAG TPA: ABC transporter permease [Roseimicrobium sp.]|nr:ABC transporter permease [Roseimicrobium sp.]
MLLLPAFSLAKRELVRFLRQRNRIIGALATPIVFWLLIGLGMGRSFKADTPGGGDYLQYFFPGTVMMVILFTAIFSTISIIEDRREGFLQSVLVAPVPRMAIVLGKILGGTVLASGQAMIFLLLAPLAGIGFSVAGFLLSMMIVVLTSFALTGLGVCIAWRMSSTQGFHAIMNLFLMPMWFLSGALFPPDQARGGLKWVMAVNPLTYALSALRQSMFWKHDYGTWAIQTLVTIAFGAVMFILASRMVAKPIAADLQ